MPPSQVNPENQVLSRAKALLGLHEQVIYRRTDRLFAVLMALQWLAGIAAAYWIAPRTWIGPESSTNPTVLAALLLGGLVSIFPILLALWKPGWTLTRHITAVAQLVMSGLLIHFTGGRIETHFHIFGSLAFLAFYRDWPVLITASVVTAADHFFRGYFWPQSVYGVVSAQPWRWLEHTGWVVFTDIFLIISIVQSRREMWNIACRQAQIELTEAALQRSNSVLIAQQEAAIDGILIVDENSRVVSHNRRYRELWGLSHDLMQSRDSEEILEAVTGQVADPETFRARTSALLAQPQERGRSELLLKDGRVFDRYSAPVRLQSGTVIGRIWCYRDITDNKRAEEALRQAHDELERRVEQRTAALARANEQNRALLDAAGEGICGLDADGLTTFINPTAAELLGFSEEELRGKPMHVLLHHTRPDGSSYPDDECPIYACMRDGDVHRVGDETFWRADGSSFPVEYIATPLRDEGRIVGSVVVFRDISERLRAAQQIAHLHSQLEQRLDSIVALNAELANAYDATIAGWSRALDLRDHETEGHSLRVTEMTLALAETFGIAGEPLLHIRRGALLHDIGKMGVPDAILNKPGPLTEDERMIMCLHPTYAYEMLAGIPFVHPALDIPYCHHEKWDGTGYPRGLAGEEIPFAARLFAVVDVWDALRSDRPYRRAWPVEKTRAHIAALAGTHFDPQVVEVFLREVTPIAAADDVPEVPMLRAA